MSEGLGTQCDLYELVQLLTQKLRRKHGARLNYEGIINVLSDVLQGHGLLQFSDWHPDVKNGGLYYHTFTKKVLALPERVISGSGDEQILDQNHFIIQIFRIPLKESPTLLNLLKIAVYTGILTQTMKAQDYPEGIVKAFNSLKMHQFINYVSREEYNTLLSRVPKDIGEVIKSSMVDVSK